MPHFEIHAQDVEAAKAFYGGLFGWEFESLGFGFGARGRSIRVASGSCPPPGSPRGSGRREDQRMVFILREYEGLDYREIANVTGVNEGTVKSRLFRAK